MMRRLALLLAICGPLMLSSQEVYDDFEGGGTISGWVGDACEIDDRYPNPWRQGSNTSTTVMQYRDVGGQYANVRFDLGTTFDLATGHVFSVQIYVPSSGLVGAQPYQLSLKLQDAALPQPWATQTEIIKPIALDSWQTIVFDFAVDDYINLDGQSPPPLDRLDFSRVLLQVNGEDNMAQVEALIDNFTYDGSIPAEPVYDQLVWADEFDTDGPIDASRWFHQTRLPIQGSWYNGEIQHYTDRPDNAIVKDGVLRVVARKEAYTDQGVTKEYTSARLNSKYAFTYGKVEVRARLPRGVGTWPAIWMLGTNITEAGAYWETQGLGTTPWPDCGEIDIMEHWGTNQDYVQSATHTRSSFGNTVNKGGRVLPTASDDYHVYAMAWSEDKLVFTIDDVVHYTYRPVSLDAETWPFAMDQYLLLNVAVQDVIDPSIDSAVMEVDYVRVYQQRPVSTSTLSTAEVPQRYYPNPVVDRLTIDVGPAATEVINVTIYDLAGIERHRVACQPSSQSITVDDLQALLPGLYLVSYAVNGRSYQAQIVKQ